MKPDVRQEAQEGLFAQLEKLQGDTCGMCGRDDMGDLRVDHDHDSGLIRGLLCQRCNTVEGRHGRTSPHLWEECAVCAWRKYPAVTWLGWTVAYNTPDLVGIVQRFTPVEQMAADYIEARNATFARMFNGDAA